jgi:hypothetical protein
MFSHSPLRRQHRRSVPGSSGESGGRRRLIVEQLENRTLPSGNVISGFVFNDLNNNGILDPGESGLANVPLELRNASDVVIASAVTDANGYYQFQVDNTISTTPLTLQRSASVPLTATDWTRTLSVAQFDPSLGTLTSVDIINSGSITSQIKVENLDSAPATLTATVSGSLTLSGPGFHALVTNGSSSKSFNAGPYDGVIDFDDPSGHDFGPQTASASTSFTVTNPSDLASFIGMGAVALSEVAHATSSASGAGNLVAQINTTAAAQVSVVYHYTPNNGLRPGVYKIIETNPPASFLDGKLSSNGGVIPDSVGKHAITVTLAANNLPHNDFAALAPASVAGFVYQDMNDNGIKEGGEAGIPGVTIALTGTNDLGSVSLSTTTAADGSYQFHNLRPGNYSITQTEPTGYLHGKNGLGSLGGTLASDQVIGLNVNAGALGNNYDFAELVPANLSGFVYQDANNNGIKDPGEAGIPQVTVTLSGMDDKGLVNLTTVTAGDGGYQFRNLRPGSYTVSETEPVGYIQGKSALGSPGGTVLSNLVLAVNLGVGVVGTNYDFAELGFSSLSGYVYLDANNNGAKDPGEAGISSVTVALLGTNDQGPVNFTTTTAADGSYHFRGLRPGSYTIQETEPAGYVRGKNTLGWPGGTILSDQLIAVNLDVQTTGTEYDFAELNGPGSLSGYVFVETNGVARKDARQPGIPGVQVTLVGTSDLGQSINLALATSSDGSYRFVNVRPGTYAITETQPAGYIHGDQTVGTVGGTVGDHRFSSIALPPGVAGTDYNFGELTPPNAPGMILADTFAFPADFAHPVDVAILSKLQFLSSTNGLDPNLVAEAAFVDGLYRHVLGRPAEATSLVSWVQMLQNGASRAQVVDAVWNSAEHRGLEVDRLYATFLHRGADAAGRASWVNAMLSGVSEMDVARVFIASPEFQAAHADNVSYVAALYATILRPNPSGPEIDGWVATLKSGVSRDAVANAFLTSGESYQLIVNRAYAYFLHRSGDAAGNQVWIAQLLQGSMTPGMVCKTFLASDEFFALARNASGV